jgi:uncharacterized membrane protein
MYDIAKLLHLASAIVWLGGMTFALFMLRPAALAQLEPQPRLRLMSRAMGRFFVAVWVAVAVLLLTGLQMYGAGAAAISRAGGSWQSTLPLGWHLMFGIGILMFLIYAHLYFAVFRKLQRAVAASDWSAAGGFMAKLQPLVMTNFVLGWLAVAALRLIR